MVAAALLDAVRIGPSFFFALNSMAVLCMRAVAAGDCPAHDRRRGRAADPVSC
jgi:hypothetical protein